MACSQTDTERALCLDVCPTRDREAVRPSSNGAAVTADFCVTIIAQAAAARDASHAASNRVSNCVFTACRAATRSEAEEDARPTRGEAEEDGCPPARQQ